ncbi:uncharacterized protein LOC126824179 [Patella vulgata]|uniref:uncharacterized protein LOC126824179 n=1 Tax=Patella vulgata TaxID=6465 RepID=UPI0024A9C32C|nr:uncharacterized protein LOC126824179 [Patella vulgata]
MASPVKLSEVVLTGHKNDLAFIKKLADSLKAGNLDVWFHDPSSNERGAGQRKSQAIMGCKIFAPVLSKDSVQEKSFSDELALAYISNSAIFPVGLSSFPEISAVLDVGSKLILARINWIFVCEDSEYNDSISNLMKSVNHQLELMNNMDTTVEIGTSNFIETHGMVISANQFTHTSNDYERAISPPKSPEVQDTQTVDFWDLHFKNRTQVKWTEFRDKFQQDYNSRIAELFTEDNQKLFRNLMYQDIFDLRKTVERKVYDKFCNDNPYSDPHCFFNQLQEYVIAHISLRQVFNMDSTLRITTIQNLGNFSFPAIVRGLTDMLKDEDPNIRAVAAIALAKSGKNRPDTVYKFMIFIFYRKESSRYCV